MVIVRLRGEGPILNSTGPTYTEGKDLRFPEATGWTVEDTGNSAVLCIIKPLKSAACACDDDTELLASIPWHTVQMVHVPDALEASV